MIKYKIQYTGDNIDEVVRFMDITHYYLKEVEEHIYEYSYNIEKMFFKTKVNNTSVVAGEYLVKLKSGAVVPVNHNLIEEL